jgi:hypothetical protein
MAVCGRCLICGYKFDCTERDVAIRWNCKDDGCNWGPDAEHAICRKCHDALTDNAELEQRARDLLALVNARG